MELKDLIITPIFLGIFYLLAYAIRPKVSNAYTKKYFIPALTVKFVGALSLGFIYQFYYGGGDTFNYFNQSKPIHAAFFDSPSIGLKLLLSNDGIADGSMQPYTAKIDWFNSQTEYIIVKICAVFGLFCGHTYSTIALMFAAVSFTGIWALYGTVTRLYPALYEKLAISIFFIPSVFFWGSGITKDSLCLGALGWLFYGFYNFFVARRTILRAIVALILAGILIKLIKIYIIISFIPPVMIWVAGQYSSRIKSGAVRGLVWPIMLTLGIGVGFILSRAIAAGNDNYDFSKIESRAEVASAYHNRISTGESTERGHGGSGYSMPNFTGPQDIPKLVPQAITVGLFRPFLWEVRNPVMLFSALEIFWITILAVRIFYRVGFIVAIREITGTPLVLFGVIFALIFAIATAITSGNFGNLVRYRIPMWPFYVTALFVLESKTSIVAARLRPNKRQTQPINRNRGRLQPA